MVRFKALVVLFFLSIIDALIPLPVFGFVALYVILNRPPWFLRLVLDIYRGGHERRNVAKNDH